MSSRALRKSQKAESYEISAKANVVQVGADPG